MRKERREESKGANNKVKKEGHVRKKGKIIKDQREGVILFVPFFLMSHLDHPNS